ncbi:hypothetical protein [Gilvimarinus algae]|uniref:DUF1871 family protein n=1 Tax=Gilvimarinus algae TaxID=3058037 RepID=A0ABT8TJ69_9GAMM|nr:hypothetical protein [Gilvimarinus sp. SDUM040014]MDO3382377.1 hypothetical protein [Gilvimarinus sp. SDUM040014]
MMSVHLDRAKALQKEIQKILIEEWDPIGVGDIPEAEHEYDSYVPELYKMLISRKPKHEIFEYIWWLETEHMGLTGDRQRSEMFAERLYNLA